MAVPSYSACALLLTAIAAMAQNQAPASVSGSVVNSVTGSPVVRAHVGWANVAGNANGQPTAEHTVITDGSGKFSFEGLPAGEYFCTVARTGFVANRRDGNLRVKLAAGEKKENVTFQLDPVAVITGRVLDENGEPLEGVDITAEMGSYRWAGTAQTNERGEYRIGGLAPGTYRVRAKVNEPSLLPETRTDGTRELHYAVTWFPSAVTVGSGTEAAGTDIRLTPAPILGISGKVMGFSSNSRVFIQLHTLNSGISASGASRPDGTFDLWRVDPGKYTVTAQSGNERSIPVDVEVGSANVEGVELRLAVPVDIEIATEDADPPPQNATPPPQRTQGAQQSRALYNLVLRSSDGQQSMAMAAQTEKIFKLQKVSPAIYKVTVMGLSGYVLSTRVGDTTTDGNLLDVRYVQPGTPIALSIGHRMATVSGKVMNATDATVVVQSEDADSGMPLRVSKIGADGTYQIRGLTPGKYQIGIVPTAELDAIRGGTPLENGEAVELHPGEEAKKDLLVR